MNGEISVLVAVGYNLKMKRYQSHNRY